MRSPFWDDTDSNCFKVYVIECESKLEQPDPLSDNVVSDKSLKEIRIKNLNRIVLAHFNINSLRNTFEFLPPKLHEMLMLWDLTNKTRWFVSWKSI